MKFGAPSRYYKGALTQKRSFLVNWTSFISDFNVSWKKCQNKHSKFYTKFVICLPIEMTWSAHKLPKYGLYWQYGRNLRQFGKIQAKSNLCHNFAYDAIAGGISGRLFWIPKGQNEFMKSSILQNSHWKIWRISALASKTRSNQKNKGTLYHYLEDFLLTLLH